jgi:SAM-dependent methyltransferase
MSLGKLIAGQLARPSGLTGRLILARLWNRRNSALNDATFAALALASNDRVLEVGFGGGYLLGRMSRIVTGGLLAGVDVSPAMIASCTRRFRTLVRDGKLDLRCASAESLPFPSAFFSKACSVNSIFYWPDPARGILELSRVLAAGGKLVLCFTAPASLQRGLMSQGITPYGAGEVRAFLEAAQFRDITLTSGADKHRDFLCAIGYK